MPSPESTENSGLIDRFLSPVNFSDLLKEWRNAQPINHIVIDDFLKSNIIDSVVSEFPNYDNDAWRIYDNVLENKKALNYWDKFGLTTYQLFTFFCSAIFVEQLEAFTGCELFADIGLNGGGLHTHKHRGHSNLHRDYSIHPKLKLERKLNLLIYVTPSWEVSWGGDLQFWTADKNRNQPSELKKSIAPVFNRAILFDTTQNAWHGLPEPIMCPEEITRNSLAVYYLGDPGHKTENRGKALFAPFKDQSDDPEILTFIEKRASVTDAEKTYGDER